MVSMNLMSAKCERIVSSLPTSESVKFLSVNLMLEVRVQIWSDLDLVGIRASIWKQFTSDQFKTFHNDYLYLVTFGKKIF